MSDLLCRMGGQEIIKRLVKRLYIDLLNNDELLPYLAENLDSPMGIIELEEKQTKFFQSVLSNQGSPRDKFGHPLIQKHLKEEHFAMVLSHLRNGMERLDIPVDVQSEVVQAIKATREMSI